jgi:hypothetical protein
MKKLLQQFDSIIHDQKLNWLGIPISWVGLLGLFFLRLEPLPFSMMVACLVMAFGLVLFNKVLGLFFIAGLALLFLAGVLLYAESALTGWKPNLILIAGAGVLTILSTLYALVLYRRYFAPPS